jgi:hypothetical protein
MQEKTPEPARGRIIPCPLGFEKRIFRLQEFQEIAEFKAIA